jgi:hypothetical protein
MNTFYHRGHRDFIVDFKWNKCKHILLPLHASPETGEELTAFARKIILPHSLILKILLCIFLCVFSALRERKME